MQRLTAVLAILVCLWAGGTYTLAQNQPSATSTQVQMNQSLYYLTPISATAAVGSAATLTLPATPGLYNYVCSITLEVSQNGTSTANTNAVSSTTNFNSFATKWSLAATANLGYVWGMNFGTPAAGCAKSAAAGTATTFVSPSNTNTAYSWEATYFQAP